MPARPHFIRLAIIGAALLCTQALLPGGGARQEVAFPKEAAPRNDIVIENRMAVPMRDGVVLAADVYRPADEGKYPVIVSRTPYSTERYPSSYDVPVYYARRGYVYVFQDVRGRHESEGKWEPFRNDILDGYDTIEWAARQPWSNGKVAMQGGSYAGLVQWLAAMAKPPSLITIFPHVASTSPYHDWITLNGGWRLSFNFGWGAVRQESRIMQNVGVHELEELHAINYANVLWHLPLQDMQKLVGRNTGFYRDWINHPNYDEYWRALSAEEQFAKLEIPVHTMGGWFDIFLQGTIRGFVGVTQKGRSELARRKSRMVIGPWGHGPSQKTGDLDFGPDAFVEARGGPLELRWFDYWLKGIDNGLDKEPPVLIFVMGLNKWRYENEWPPARTEYTKMYFKSNGHANSLRGDGSLSWDLPPADSPPDRYTYHPEDPVPSLGGNNCCGTPTLTGPRDQRSIEARRDVLVYTSDFLTEDLEVTGPVKVILHASSDAPDTDFIAKLVDVYPDGRAFNVAEGILRARYRDSLSEPALLEPGRIYKLEIDLVATSNVFLKGHRIRVDVTSSHFPQFDRNPNTGEPFGKSSTTRPATQTIHHPREHASHVLLPVIPNGAP